jgi:DMSO/TMAO reductase YedYZ heme-binding membrane subunit
MTVNRGSPRIQPAGPIGGWALLGLTSCILAAMTILIVWTMGANAETARALVRLTGRTSLIFFCLAFGAAAIGRLMPGPLSAWLVANRRYLGLSFVVSHLIHAGALVAFARLDPALFAEATNPAMFVFGGLGYAFVVLMGVTSFDRTAALLGPGRWRLLHLTGGYYLALIFLQAEAKRAADPAHWPYLALVVGVLALRLIARRRVARRRGVRPAP